jgi:hypothetical protein
MRPQQCPGIGDMREVRRRGLNSSPRPIDSGIPDLTVQAAQIGQFSTANKLTSSAPTAAQIETLCCQGVPLGFVEIDFGRR